MTNSSPNKILNPKELFNYAIFGFGATLTNIISYYILADLIGIDYLVSNALAWIFAFLFAYVTNKLWVFESKSWDKEQSVPEFIEFFGFRLFTGILDMVLMYLFVSIMLMDGLFSKIIVNIIVIIINYVASKFIIFKERKAHD